MALPEDEKPAMKVNDIVFVLQNPKASAKEKDAVLRLLKLALEGVRDDLKNW